MRRILLVLTVALVLVAMLGIMASPALGDQNNPFQGTGETGDASCIYKQIFNNGINPQWHCAGNDPL